jgi:hypothetical protein
MPLSGRFRLRKAMFAKLVLQVEDMRKSWPWSAHETPHWRDAKPIDLAATELRALMDLSIGRLLSARRAPLPVQTSASINGEVPQPQPFAQEPVELRRVTH